MNHHRSKRISFPSAISLLLLPFSYNHLFLFFLPLSFPSPSPPPLIPAAVPGGEGSRDDQAFPEEPGAGLRRALHRVPLLSLPPDGGFRSLRLGLDHCPQTLQSQLLLRPVRVHVHAEIPAHSPGAACQPPRLRRALLYPHKDVTH